MKLFNHKNILLTILVLYTTYTTYIYTIYYLHLDLTADRIRDLKCSSLAL